MTRALRPSHFIEPGRRGEPLSPRVSLESTGAGYTSSRSICDECIEWDGTIDKRPGKGYGVISSGPHHYKKAHRVVFEEVFGSIPHGFEVCHRCDNPPCVNIDHLFLGTRSQNNEDAARKGRVAGQKLSVADVHKLRSLADTTDAESLSKQFGIRANHVREIVSRKKWRHV